MQKINIKKLLTEIATLINNHTYKDAESKLLILLSKFPHHPEALLNYGTILLIREEYMEGIKVLEQLIKIDPFEVKALNNLANAYISINDLNQAKAYFERAIRIDPKYVEARYNFANLLRQLKNENGALEEYSRVVEINNKHIYALNNRGELLTSLKKYNEAIKDFDRAIDNNPHIYEFYINRGRAHEKNKDINNACKDYEFAKKINPDRWEAYLFNAEINKDINSLKAINDYRMLLRLQPEKQEHKHELIAELIIANQFDEAEDKITEELRRDPFNPKLHNLNSDLALKRNNRDLSDEDCLKILELDPTNEQANFKLGLSALLTKNYSLDAWLKYEKLFSKQNEGYHLIAPEWDGKPFQGKLYIWGDQGIGDQIMYASMLSEVYQIHQNILCSIDQRLIPLFERSFKGIQFIPLEEEIGLEHIKTDTETKRLIQSQIALGRLGKLFRKDINDFKNHKQHYIVPDSDKTKALRQRLTAHKKKICGISWKSKNEKIGLTKTADLVDFLPALQLKDYVFVDLQYGDNEKEKNTLAKEHNIDIIAMDDIDNFNDIDDLYALVDACDVVMTTSNVTAHIAGSLGKETFLLLPYFYGVLWYWHKEDDKSLWYPSIEIFRQSSEDDWTDPIENIAKKLKGG